MASHTRAADINGNESSVEAEDIARLDTGASFCVFQRELGEAPGRDVAIGEQKRIATVVGGFDALGHEVHVAAVGVELDTMVYFAADRTSFPIR